MSNTLEKLLSENSTVNKLVKTDFGSEFDKYELIAFGDVHLGHKCVDKKLLKEMLEYMYNTPNLYLLGLGDLIEAATVESVGGGIFEQEEFAQKQYENIADLLKPLKGRIVGLHCLSSDTLILTKDGWKSYAELTKEDKVFSLNITSGRLEEHSINEIILGEYDGNMIHLTHKNTDQLLTPNHNVFLRHRNGKIMFIKANRLYDRFHIPISGIFKGNTISLSNDEIRLLAWIICDGTIRNKKDITIYASSKKPKKFNRIKSILGRLNIKYSIYTYAGRTHTVNESEWYAIYIPIRQSMKFIELLSKGKTRIPNMIFQADYNQRLIFFKELMRGDGHIANLKSKSFGFTTSNEELAKDLVRLCLTLNMRAQYRKRVRDTNIKKSAVSYDMNIVIRNRVALNARQGNIQIEKYSGLVWCVNTPLHNFVAMRNGKAFITGNSGNHEERIMKHSGFNIIKTLCRELECEYLGWGVLHEWKVGDNIYTAYSTHGRSGATTLGGKLNALKRMGDAYDVDAILTGHVHDLHHFIEQIYSIKDGIPITKKKHHILTGSYLSYWDSYAQMKGYKPASLGSPKIKLHASKWDLRVSL